MITGKNLVYGDGVRVCERNYAYGEESGFMIEFKKKRIHILEYSHKLKKHSIMHCCLRIESFVES